MVKNFLKKANSLVLAAALTAAMMPAPASMAAQAAEETALQQTAKAGDLAAPDLASVIGKDYTVIEGNTPVLPKKVMVTADNGTLAATEIQWASWDAATAAGDHEVTGTAGKTQLKVKVSVLPCDEAVEDVIARGSSGSNDVGAVHALRGYKGLFVAEYDIVLDAENYVRDRAVIYLPKAANPDDHNGVLDSDSCWDYGARLQFKFDYNDTRYFQTAIGVVDGKTQYYPMNDGDLRAALDRGEKVDRLLAIDDKSTYRVRTVMDTTTDTTNGNFKIYVTDPEGIEHEITKEGGNVFRIYPTDGIVKNFAAVRGGYSLKNHKISWISGYATKNTETYMKAKDAASYVKEGETVVTKELPGELTSQQSEKIVKNNQLFSLDAAESGWYKDGQKVQSVTAKEGDTVTYRAYYKYEKDIDKAALKENIQKAGGLKEEEYTSGSWKTLKDALTQAGELDADTSADQESVTDAAEALGTALENLVSIKKLKEAVTALRAELTEKEAQKADYANWDDVEFVLKSAEAVLARAGATKAQVESAEASLVGLELISKAQQELADAKKAMEDTVTAAEEKIAGLKESDYTTESWKALQDALAACKGLDAATASKDDYIAKKQDLDLAVEGLAKRSDSQGSAVKVKSVKAAAKNYKIAAGKKLDLKKVFTVSPKNASNKKLTYSVDKKFKNYASIKSGKITVKAKGAGKTITVKAQAADGSGKKASIKIKIMKHAVTKITVKKKSLTVKAGRKVTIKPNVKTNGKSANKALTYTSSNTKLATVKNGKVTTKRGKTGNVTITIKSTDGTNKSAKVKIKIKK